ncbi:MAG: radical SAM protein, partial [Planctomycetota bacterium]
MTSDCGLYVHVPFCRRKCRYCDFYSRPPDGAGELDRFAEAVVREMELTQESVRLCAQTHTYLGLGTVYFGGGTPSMLGAGRLAKILSAARKRWQIAPDSQCVHLGVQTNTSASSPLPEITIEANPLDVTPHWAAGALEAGFNRVSIGVQSINNDDLRFLGRLHHAGDGVRAVETARAAGFDEIGIDLIYGLPGQTAGMLRQRVTRAVESCRPEHVSCYQLT